jgi:hypothetical protein
MAILDASWHRRDQGTGVASQMAGRGCGTRWESGVVSGTCMGLRSELLGQYSAEVHAIEELPSSKRRGSSGTARAAGGHCHCIRYGVMSPVVLVAIRERGRNRDRQA